MDVTKLTVKLPVDQFYDTYIATIRDLYTASFIAQNHLEPSTKSSFQRAMSKRAGISLDIREDTKQYTHDDLVAIVNDTNAKYEEYANGDYSESTKTRGIARYRLMSTVLKEAFIRLGYDDIAAMFKYTDDNDEEQSTNDDVSVVKEQEEDITVKKNTEMLRESLAAVKAKIKEFSAKDLSDEDKEIIRKLDSALKDTIKSAAKCVDGRPNVDDLKDLIRQGEEYVMKLEDIIAGENKEKLEQIVAQQPESSERTVVREFEVPFTDIVKVLKILPGFVENLQGAIEQNKELKEQVQELKKEINAVKQQTVLPTGEDDLVKLAKEIINKIEDKSKLKDIGMVIMMKAL